jgi:hypothetical protein
MAEYEKKEHFTKPTEFWEMLEGSEKTAGIWLFLSAARQGGPWHVA